MDKLKSTYQFIKELGLHNDKSLGQNFIINESLTDKIVANIELENKIAVEIGPGPACLTRSILKKRPKKLILIEMDSRFTSIYHELASFYQVDIDVINSDCLEVDFSGFGNEVSVISNLPYNISTQIYAKLISEYDAIKTMVLMFQKEVGDRIIAKAGDKNFARLGALTNLVGSAKKLFLVKPSAFLPPPKVMSMVIKYEKSANKSHEINAKNFQNFSKILFAQKRKVIANVLKSGNINLDNVDSEVLTKRPHQLSIDEIISLYDLFSSN